MGGVALLSSAVMAAGCGVDDGSSTDDDVTLRTGAITRADFQNTPGTVKVRVKTCDFTASQTVNCTYCPVDSGWTLIGGGAEIEGENNPGARLKTSSPNPNSAPPLNCTGSGTAPPLSSWLARSVGAAHRLRAYVVAIQVPGLSPGDLGVFTGDSAGVTTIDKGADEVIPGYIMVGGGAEVVPPDADAFLTESYPVDGSTWRASAKFQSASGGGVKSYVTVINPCPPAWTGHCFTFPKVSSAVTGPNSGYGTTSLSPPYPYLTTSIGESARSGSGAGRYLADLIPLNGSALGARVRSKAGTAADSGQTFGYTVSIADNQDPALFNAIIFISGGYTSRSSGGVFQQATSNPDTPAGRWYLEPFGAGVYRLHNGNPGTGTECAFRVASTSDVRVAACGTTDAFKWTLFSGTTASVFQIRNVNANRCLDNDNLGFVTSDLKLRTCSTGAGSQQLFLDHFNWPPP